MDIQIIINTAAGPRDVAKFVEALQGLGTPSTDQPKPVYDVTFPDPTPIIPTPVQQVQPQPQYAQPVPAPVQQPMYTPPAPIQQAPVAPQQLPVTPPVAPPAVSPATPPPVTTPAPTTAPTYQLQDLMRAGADVASISPDHRAKVLALIQSFGAQAVNQIPKERFAEYAAGLRGLGAKL